MKATAIAPANIAFVKYWGKKDEILRLPENGSISMNLKNFLTTTTVEFSEKYKEDSVTYNSKKEEIENNRAVKHLDRVRKLANLTHRAKIVTKNNFPSSVGLSSSSSGFAALTLAASTAAGLSLSQKELSILARQGSGSACRSIPDGFVEWLDGDTSESSYGVSLYPPDYWEIVDVVVIVSREKKEISSTEGQKTAISSPFFPLRQKLIRDKIILCKKYLQERNFTQLGELIEQEALELHAIMLTSLPSLIYWTTGTLTIMKLVKKWRTEGLEIYFTINTGQNIHLLCEQKNIKILEEKLKKVPEVKEIIINTPAVGARTTENHLF